jgi:hypothetical protein
LLLTSYTSCTVALPLPAPLPCPPSHLLSLPTPPGPSLGPPFIPNPVLQVSSPLAPVLTTLPHLNPRDLHSPRFCGLGLRKVQHYFACILLYSPSPLAPLILPALPPWTLTSALLDFLHLLFLTLSLHPSLATPSSRLVSTYFARLILLVSLSPVLSHHLLPNSCVGHNSLVQGYYTLHSHWYEPYFLSSHSPTTHRFPLPLLSPALLVFLALAPGTLPWSSFLILLSPHLLSPCPLAASFCPPFPLFSWLRSPPPAHSLIVPDALNVLCSSRLASPSSPHSSQSALISPCPHWYSHTAHVKSGKPSDEHKLDNLTMK